MNIKLTKADRQSILGRVRLVNDYFKNVWQNYERVMIIRRRNVKRRQPQEREIRELTRQNPHYDDNASEALPKDFDAYEGMLEPDPIDADSNSVNNRVTNIIPPQNDFKMDCDDTRMEYRVEYRKRLIGLLYGYLYQAYGRGIPTGLGHYLDFKGISRDAEVALDDLATWWDAKGEGQTLPSYAAYHNDLLTRRAHQDYDKKAYRWMDSLVRKNGFHKSSKRVIRIDKKADDDWFEDDWFENDSPYRLGSASVNALLYWLTAHHQLPIRDKKHRYQDHDFQEGMNRLNNHYLSNVRIYKDRSYSIAFRSAKVADEVSRILQHEAEAFRYEAYVRKIKKFPDDFHGLALDTQDVQLSSTLINTNIHVRFEDTPHKAYRFLGLLKKTFQRFQDEIGRQIVKGHIPDKSDWEYPTALSNIRAYYQGIRQTYQGFSLDTFQDILDSQNINKVILDNAYPDTYRKIHRTIGRFSNAYRDNDIRTCYQNLGIQQGLRLAFKNLPVAYQQVAKRYAD